MRGFQDICGMKIQFWSVGKTDESYVKEGIRDFTERISRYYPVSWRIIPPAKQTASTPEDAVKKTEGATILGLLTKDDYLVLLDERGKNPDSVEFSKFIAQRANESTRQLVFLIGGAFGVDEAVKQRAQYVWSLSKLVFPHQLVRLILAEQVYRACTIQRNEKYHHV